MSDSRGPTQAPPHAWRDFSAMQAALSGRLNTYLQEDSRPPSADYAVLVADVPTPYGPKPDVPPQKPPHRAMRPTYAHGPSTR